MHGTLGMNACIVQCITNALKLHACIINTLVYTCMNESCTGNSNNNSCPRKGTLNCMNYMQTSTCACVLCFHVQAGGLFLAAPAVEGYG